ncbi:MAG: 4Fe-4S dicluster domain-containing protein [Candidatus Aminicenantes bacterium]|nr:4Fe-4S dicluster domain-containing protein [Candidatus Aminicenantes bacterium]MDH5714411.1 4Fe-4S dicluster domain-containing protein [Candidatus Aminicenantes bacterium]
MPKIDLDFKKKLTRVEYADFLTYCYQCGACVGDCPSAKLSPAFNPREIVLRVLLGLAEPLLKKDSIIWQCTTCYTCQEVCPQGVRPIEVITALKNIISAQGMLPDSISASVGIIKDTGRVVLVSDVINKRRTEQGLTELKPVPMDELKKIL